MELPGKIDTNRLRPVVVEALDLEFVEQSCNNMSAEQFRPYDQDIQRGIEVEISPLTPLSSLTKEVCLVEYEKDRIRKSREGRIAAARTNNRRVRGGRSKRH
jgi:hypothetical protein